MKFNINSQSGFTLLEILVAVAIMAILVSVVIMNINPARETARDGQRQADMRTIEAALTLYKNKYGQYPEACNGPTTNMSTRWSGQSDSSYRCTDGSTQYIRGLVPEFIPKLPVDPKLKTSPSGYVYIVNTERSVYKFMVFATVETESVTTDHPFFRCGADYQAGFASGQPSHEDPGICVRTPALPSGNYSASAQTSGRCTNPVSYQSTYAVSAGFSNDRRGNTNFPLRGQEYDTEIIRCQ